VPWFRRLQRTAANGGIKPTLHNLLLILGEHGDWQGVLAFDQYS